MNNINNSKNKKTKNVPRKQSTQNVCLLVSSDEDIWGSMWDCSPHTSCPCNVWNRHWKNMPLFSLWKCEKKKFFHIGIGFQNNVNKRCYRLCYSYTGRPWPLLRSLSLKACLSGICKSKKDEHKLKAFSNGRNSEPKAKCSKTALRPQALLLFWLASLDLYMPLCNNKKTTSLSRVWRDDLTYLPFSEFLSYRWSIL